MHLAAKFKSNRGCIGGEISVQIRTRSCSTERMWAGGIEWLKQTKKGNGNRGRRRREERFLSKPNVFLAGIVRGFVKGPGGNRT